MNLKSLFPLFMLEYAGVLREFACVCLCLREFACVCVNMLELLVFAFICWVRLCLREYAGVVYVCLYLLGSLVFVRSLLEYAGVCLNFPGYGQVRSVRMRSVRGRPDEGRSGSPTLMRPGRFDWMLASRGRLDEVRSGSTTLMRPGST